nr:MAG TPA: hypothetical protein [Caudoviricetes sp.]
MQSDLKVSAAGGVVTPGYLFLSRCTCLLVQE